MAKAKAIEKEEIFIIGGGQIFEQTIALADTLHLTVIQKEYPGNIFFPDYSQFNKTLFKEEHEENGLKYTFVNLAK